jgi:peptidoglycan hydrolase-like protein with peptidoglycan-binding domain
MPQPERFANGHRLPVLGRAVGTRHPIENMMNRFLLSLLGISFSIIASVSANDNVRAAQTKLKEGGFYFGEVDGVVSSDLSAAVTRYQIRNGLQITGQLDKATSKALGVEAAMTTTASEPAKTSDTWRRLRKSDQQFLTKKNEQSSRAPAAASSKTRVASAQDDLPAEPANVQREAEAAQAPPPQRPTAALVPARPGDRSLWVLSPERLRDYIGAFVLAGLDPRVGAELEFFGDRVRYYNDGVVNREEIRRDLQRYAARWPERRFWIGGEVSLEAQPDSLLRVTFPLRFELRNGSKRSSGQVQKTLLLEVTGEDLWIVAVNESKAR